MTKHMRRYPHLLQRRARLGGSHDVFCEKILIGPKGLPRPIMDRINGEVTTTLKLTETAEKLASDGVSPAGGTPEQFLATIKREIEVWRRVVNEAGVKVE